MLSTLRGLYFATVVWLFTVVATTLILAFQTISFRRLPDRWTCAMIHFWGRTSLWLAGIRLEAVNASTLIGREPRIMTINHQSMLDVLWVAAIMPPGHLCLGKRELIYIPFINWAFWAFRWVRIDRSKTELAIKTLGDVARTIVDQRRTLVVAPEGTRTFDGDMLPFKKGAFHMALDTKAPIHPVVVSGAFELSHKPNLLPRPGTIRIRYLDPIPTTHWKAETLEQHIADVHRIMLEAYEAMRRTPQAEDRSADIAARRATG